MIRPSQEEYTERLAKYVLRDAHWLPSYSLTGKKNPYALQVIFLISMLVMGRQPSKTKTNGCVKESTR